MALLDARTDRPFWGRRWLAEVMGEHVAGLGAAGQSTPGTDAMLGWSVVSVLGSQTLVQSRPVLRNADLDPLDDFLRAEAACTIGAYNTGIKDEAAPRDVVRTARFRRFVAAAAGVSLGEERRRAVLDLLPPFLRRDAYGKTDTDLLLLRVLARLHEQGDFTQALPDPEAVRAAMTSLRPLIQTDGPFAIFLGSARTVAVMHEGGSLFAFEPPEAIRPTTRRFSNRGQEGSPASVLLWTAAPDPPTPIAGAERITAGIVSAETQTPTAICR